MFKTLIEISINIKSLLILIIVFILFTVIGTLSHEYGHIAIAKMFNYDTKLHYASMNYYPKGYLEDKDVIAFKKLIKDYKGIGYKSWSKEIREKAKKYNQILKKRYERKILNNVLIIRIGGPLQTILTGTIGFLILVWRRKSIYKNGMTTLDWLLVFLSLFWLREVFNLVLSIGSELVSPNGTWFGGDEFYISQELNLWPGFISIVLAILGITVTAYVIFNIIPKKMRLTFIISGVIGGIVGFILWMNIIGPKLLP